MASSKMLFAPPDSEDMKFFSVKSNASAATGEFSTPPESPTIKTKEPRTSSSSAEGSADSGATPAAAVDGDAARPPIPPPRIRRPGNSKLERLKLAEGGGGGGGGTSGVVGGGGVLSVSDMILAPPPPPTNNEHFLKGSERADGLTT